MPATEERHTQDSSYLHGMPNATLRHIVQRERVYHEGTHEHWAFEAMVASLYLDLDTDSIASQSAYAVQWQLGWLDGDHDKDRARMRLRRNWWSAVVRAVIYRATSGGRQLERGPATRIPEGWWSVLDAGDPLRVAYHEAQQKQQHADRAGSDQASGDTHDEPAPAAPRTERSPRKGSTQDAQDVEDARSHWAVDMVERFRTSGGSRLSDREAVQVWKVARSYPPDLARRLLKKECEKTRKAMKDREIPHVKIRIDYLMRDFRQRCDRVVQREHDKAAQAGRRPRSTPAEDNAGMTYQEMVEHHQQHHCGSDLRKHYRIDEHGAWHHTS